MSGREKMGKREESVLVDEPAVNSRSCEILVFQPESSSLPSLPCYFALVLFQLSVPERREKGPVGFLVEALAHQGHRLDDGGILPEQVAADNATVDLRDD